MANRKLYARQTDLEEVKSDVRDIRHNDIKHLNRKVAYILGALAVLIPLIVLILGKVW